MYKKAMSKRAVGFLILTVLCFSVALSGLAVWLSKTNPGTKNEKVSPQVGESKLGKANFVMDDAKNTIIGLTNDYMVSTDGGSTWTTGSPWLKFRGQQRVIVAEKTIAADVLAYVNGYTYDKGHMVSFGGKIWEAMQVTNEIPGSFANTGWSPRIGIPAPSYYLAEFNFTKYSAADLQASLNAQKQAYEDTTKSFGYLPSWGIYGGRENFSVKYDLDYDAFTHLTYAFVKPIDSDAKGFDGSPETQGYDNITERTTNPGVRFDDPSTAVQPGGDWNMGGELIHQIRTEMNQHKDKSLIFSVGGWSYSEHNEFQIATANDYAINTFAKSIVDFMRDNGFDGVDIDWEYPKNAQEAQQYLKLHKKIREIMTILSLETEQYYWLSTATTPNFDDVQYITPTEITKYVDTVNYMAYDYNGGTFLDENGQVEQTGHNAPLFQSKLDSKKNWNIDALVTEYIRQGVPAKKLMMGIPFYSRSWLGVDKPAEGWANPDLPGLGALNDGSIPMNADGSTLSEGDWAGPNSQNPNANWVVTDPDSQGKWAGAWGNGSNPYYRMEELLAGNAKYNGLAMDHFAKDYKRYWDPEAMVPYLYSETDKVFHTYDDAESIGDKVDYITATGAFAGTNPAYEHIAKRGRLAGAMVWDITGDTRDGYHGAHHGTSPNFVLSHEVKRLVTGQRDGAYIENNDIPSVIQGVAFAREVYALNDESTGSVFSLENAPAWLSVGGEEPFGPGTRAYLSGTAPQVGNYTFTLVAKAIFMDGREPALARRTFTITVVDRDSNEMAESGHSIVQDPSKVSYIAGENFDATGLQIEIQLQNGDTRVVAYEEDTRKDFKFTPAVALTADIDKVSVEYRGMMIGDVSVAVRDVAIQSVSIQTPPTRLDYVEGDGISFNGLVVEVVYQDETALSVAYNINNQDDFIFGQWVATVLNNKIQVWYKNILAGTFEVNVSQPEVAQFVVNQNPNQLEYATGEAFNPEGLVIRIVYLNGTFADIAYSEETKADFRFEMHEEYVSIYYKGEHIANKAITIKPQEKTKPEDIAKIAMIAGGATVGALGITVISISAVKAKRKRNY